MNVRITRIVRTSFFAALVLCTGAMLAPLAAQDIAGHWVLSVDLDAGSGDANFVFEVEDGKITGTYGGTLGEQQVTGTIEGNVVKFGFESEEAGEITYWGIVDGDTMTGECDYGLVGAGTFEGRKQEG